MYEISKVRLLQIAKDSPKSKIKIKQWYPDVFDFKKGWYIFESQNNVYNAYITDLCNLNGYGTMNGEWSTNLGFHLDWMKERIDDSEVLDMLIKAGIKHGVINTQTNTTLWTYNEEEDSIKNGEGFVVYFKGSWHVSSIMNDIWDGEGWYKFTWSWNFSPDSHGYIYLKNIDSEIGYGFYDGEFRNAVYAARANSVEKSNIEEVRYLMIAEAKRRGYTRDNFMCIIGNDYGYNENIDHWSFYTDVLYTESEGNGGMVAYKNGVWANKR